MIVKNIIFLFALFLAGCGVMNNPDNSKEAIEDGAFDAGSNFSTEVSKISGESIGNINMPELDSYRLFDTSISAKLFLNDLNDSAQTLTSGDLATVTEWIKNINNVNINYQNNNFLFYPIFQNEDCGREDNVTINDKNATITVEATREECDVTLTYHVLMYKVDKSIENISIKAFDEGSVTILNQAK